VDYAVNITRQQRDNDAQSATTACS